MLDRVILKMRYKCFDFIDTQIIVNFLEKWTLNSVYLLKEKKRENSVTFNYFLGLPNPFTTQLYRLQRWEQKILTIIILRVKFIC